VIAGDDTCSTSATRDPDNHWIGLIRQR
jgi:hypothetical protein